MKYFPLKMRNLEKDFLSLLKFYLMAYFQKIRILQKTGILKMFRI